MTATRAIIHLENLSHNIQEIKRTLSPKVKMCIAVKADAYGHGAVECAKTAVENGADFLAIARVEEGKELRKNGIEVPLLILSFVCPEEIPELIEYKITPLVSDRDYILKIADECKNKNIKNYPVHLAVDTGMGRIGAFPEEAGDEALFIKNTGVLKLEGMCTHFAVSDSLSEESKKATEIQYQKFLYAIENVKSKGLDPGICHCANSASTLYSPQMHMDMVRPGIIVYGYYADDIDRKALKEKGIDIELKPVMTLETEVSTIRHFKKEMTIGYGRTWECSEDTDIAVLPVGYADGWLRSYAKSTVTINGKSYPIRGRICMDQCMVELGKNSGIKNWDKVILFGDKSKGSLTDADDVAELARTISYEVTSCITKRVPRIFVRS